MRDVPFLLLHFLDDLLPRSPASFSCLVRVVAAERVRHVGTCQLVRVTVAGPRRQSGRGQLGPASNRDGLFLVVPGHDVLFRLLLVLPLLGIRKRVELLGKVVASLAPLF